MKTAGKSKANFYCTAMLLVSACLFTAAGFSLFGPSDLPLDLRVISAVVCLAAAIVWALPALGRTSLANCCVCLAWANVIVFLFCQTQGKELLHSTRWTAIYHKAGEMAKASPFDYEKFGSFLSEQLNSGQAFSAGIYFLWIMNLLALMYLAQTEKEKVKATLPPPVQEKPDAETSLVE